MAPGVQSLFHPVIGVSAMNEALRFYRDGLGLKVTFDAYHDPAAIAALFGVSDPVVHSAVVACPDGSEIELVEWERPRGEPHSRTAGDPGLMAVNLAVRGIEGLADRLTSTGFRLRSPIVTQTLPDGGQIKVLVTEAPDDVSILLVELPEGRASLAAPTGA